MNMDNVHNNRLFKELLTGLALESQNKGSNFSDRLAFIIDSVANETSTYRVDNRTSDGRKLKEISADLRSLAMRLRDVPYK